MNLLLKLISLSAVILGAVLSDDVCTSRQCTCSKKRDIVHCDTKEWTDLSKVEFPPDVVTLSLMNNKLKFATADDRAKIENLHSLSELILNENPLGTVPSFNITKIKSLSLKDTSLLSAAFPSSYVDSVIQTISLSNNEIRSIGENDLINLANSKVTKLNLDSASLATIDQNAFTPLTQLQSLSLKNNRLKSCEFLSAFRLLSSIKLDGNQFTSLPPQLAAPKKLRTFSFTNNSIAVIDQSSPLNAWPNMNTTNLQVNLTNNPFDCCQSLWFIRFLKTSARFIPDAAQLRCAQPSAYAGQFLIKLQPDQMNCGGVPPGGSWWTTGRIIALSVGGSVAVLLLIVSAIVVIRQRKSRSGYTEIDGVDDRLPTAPPPSSDEYPFPAHGEDNDDAVSTWSTVVTRHSSASRAPTASTIVGASVSNPN